MAGDVRALYGRPRHGEADDIAPKRLVATFLRRYHHLNYVLDSAYQTKYVTDQMIPATDSSVIRAHA